MKKKLLSFFKKIIPWAVAALIFVYLFSKYPPQNIYNTLKSLNIWYFCVLSISYAMLMYLLDTFSINRILLCFGHESSFKDTLPARGLTYLIMIINYAASQAAFALYQNRRHGLPMSEMFGIFGIIVVIDLFILANLAFVTTFFASWPFTVGSLNIADFVRMFTMLGYLIFFLNIAFWKGAFGRVGFLEKLRQKDFFIVLSRAGIKDYMRVAMYRLPVHAFIMLGMYFAIKPFHASVPFLNVLANIPLIFFLGALPISPGGLGASNVALVELMKPFVSSPLIDSGKFTAGELLLSFSLVWMFANYIMKGLIGVVCLKFVSKDLFKSAFRSEDKKLSPDVSHLADEL